MIINQLWKQQMCSYWVLYASRDCIRVSKQQNRARFGEILILPRKTETMLNRIYKKNDQIN